jgi:hypothetical protein
MLITTTEQVEKTIELQTPCWLHTNNPERWHFINENGDMTTVGDGLIILYTMGQGIDDLVQREIARVAKNCHSCFEFEFKKALDNELYKIQETVTA